MPPTPAIKRDKIASAYTCLANVTDETSGDRWYLDLKCIDKLRGYLIELQNLSKDLPHYLEDRMARLSVSCVATERNRYDQRS